MPSSQVLAALGIQETPPRAWSFLSLGYLRMREDIPGRLQRKGHGGGRHPATLCSGQSFLLRAKCSPRIALPGLTLRASWCESWRARFWTSPWIYGSAHPCLANGTRSRCPVRISGFSGVTPGFAHGFRVLSESAHVLYKATDFYNPECERTILWNDPDLDTDWRLENPPVVPRKDSLGRPFGEAEKFDAC
jgi:hypothetical protein